MCANTKDICNGSTEVSESGGGVAVCGNGVGWQEMRDAV